MTKAMVYKLLEEFNGTLALKDAKKAGISPVTIKRMVDRGELDREYPGFFTLPGQFPMNCLWHKRNMSAALFRISPHWIYMI